MTPTGRKLATGLGVLAVAFTGLLSVPCLGAAQTYWYETYELTRSLINTGRFEEAAPLLTELIESHPIPGVARKVPGDRFVSYLPYSHRAMIQLHQGRLREASHSLDICEAFGAALQDRRTAGKFHDMRRRIAAMGAAEPAGAAASGSGAGSK